MPFSVSPLETGKTERLCYIFLSKDRLDLTRREERSVDKTYMSDKATQLKPDGQSSKGNGRGA
jgi:hypothetical protein